MMMGGCNPMMMGGCNPMMMGCNPMMMGCNPMTMNGMGGNVMGGNGMMAEDNLDDDDLAVLQGDAANAPAPATAASSAGLDPPAQPARPLPPPVVHYNKSDDAAITRSASMLRGVGVVEIFVYSFSCQSVIN